MLGLPMILGSYLYLITTFTMLTVKHSAKGFTRGLKFSVPRTDFSLLNLIEFNISSMAACHAPKIDNLQAYNTIDYFRLFAILR